MLDLSPVGVKLAPQLLERMVAVGIGAGIMTDNGTVGRLLSLLSSSHLSALLVWPINSGGNRKGVTELVDLVCKTLNSVFMASEMAPADASRKHAEHALVVCSLTTCFAPCSKVCDMLRYGTHAVCVLQAILEQHDVPKLLISVMESVNASDSGPMMNIFFRLLLADDSKKTESFVHQYIKARHCSTGVRVLASSWTVWRLAMISVTCREALMRLSAMVFYKMRSRDYPTSTCGQAASLRNALPIFWGKVVCNQSLHFLCAGWRDACPVPSKATSGEQPVCGVGQNVADYQPDGTHCTRWEQNIRWKL